MAYVKCLRGIKGSVIPEGSTATPTDVVGTLLNCAGIFDKEYTTIAQLIEDTTSLNTVITSNNAIDYLVRSTTFSSAITANQNAMSYIGLNNYASNTLLADSTWKSAIWSSAYVLSVLNVKVPEMTSNTTPSGVCSASSYFDSRYMPYKAFQSTDANGWQGTDAQGRFNTGTWCQYRFTSAVKIVGGTVELKGCNSEGCIIECLGSNDGFVSDTNTLNGNITFSSSTSRSTRFMTTGYTAYEYIRMRSKVKGGVGGDGLKFQFYGRVDV